MFGVIRSLVVLVCLFMWDVTFCDDGDWGCGEEGEVVADVFRGHVGNRRTGL